MKKAIVFSGLLLTLLPLFRPGKKPYSYPAHFPGPLYHTGSGRQDSLQRELGRALFYDPLLSADNSISCASCHSPYNAFAHTDHDLSHGIADRIGKRNAPALFNLAWQPVFMWDGAVNHLDMQALAPIAHPDEMGSGIGEVLEKLRSSDLYPFFFREVYGDTLISSERFLKALARFQLSLISATARYDHVKQGKAAFSEQEQRGYTLFLQHCNSCHREPLFSTYGFAANGLPPDPVLRDYGRYAISAQPRDSLVFKIPSLRNLAYTYPYMHDGRFTKLWQVLNHYSHGIQEGAVLSPELPGPLPLMADDKADLLAFLFTLNDSTFVFDIRNQYPKNIFTGSEGKGR